MSKESKEITEDEQQFIHFMNNQSGSFRTHLYRAVMTADAINKSLLLAAFPFLEVAVRYQSEEGYWENLCKRAKE